MDSGKFKQPWQKPVRNMANLADGIIIKGINADGKAFRPSDWAERLCGVMRCFERDQVGYNHITYSEYVRPTLFEGVKAVIVHRELENLKPEAYRFFLDFADSNHLVVCDLPEGFLHSLPVEA